MRPKIIDQTIELELSNEEIWHIPVRTVALHRATYFAKERGEFNGDIQESLDDDTIIVFEFDNYNILDWLQNNMSWADVEADAHKHEKDKECCYDDLLMNEPLFSII